jgi:hypothetical protein
MFCLPADWRVVQEAMLGMYSLDLGLGQESIVFMEALTLAKVLPPRLRRGRHLVQNAILICRTRARGSGAGFTGVGAR